MPLYRVSHSSVNDSVCLCNRLLDEEEELAVVARASSCTLPHIVNNSKSVDSRAFSHLGFFYINIRYIPISICNLPFVFEIQLWLSLSPHIRL